MRWWSSSSTSDISLLTSKSESESLQSRRSNSSFCGDIPTDRNAQTAFKFRINEEFLRGCYDEKFLKSSFCTWPVVSFWEREACSNDDLLILIDVEIISDYCPSDICVSKIRVIRSFICWCMVPQFSFTHIKIGIDWWLGIRVYKNFTIKSILSNNYKVVLIWMVTPCVLTGLEILKRLPRL